MRQMLIIILGFGFLFAHNSEAAKLKEQTRFQAPLAGFNAGGATVNTAATGHAKVEVIDGGTALEFRVNVSGINNLWMAHIHVAPQRAVLTENAGPIAFWIASARPPGSVLSETLNGRLAQGYVITNSQVEDWDDTAEGNGPVEGTVAELIDAIKQGRASVVVHTRDPQGIIEPGTAGNSPPGELRGTLE